MTEDSKDGQENEWNSGLFDTEIKIPESLPMSISFHETTAPEPIGTLFMDTAGKLRFDGNMAKSAEVFFEGFLKKGCDDYIEEKLKNIEKAKELCRKYAKATEIWDEFIQHDFVKMPLMTKGAVNHIGQEILDVFEKEGK